MLYSTGIGLLAEHVLTDNDLFYASTWAYLRWLEEEWGFARDNRMFVAPIFSMRDIDRTCEQLDYFFRAWRQSRRDGAGTGVRALPGRPVFRPHLGPNQRRTRHCELPHQRSAPRIQGRQKQGMGRGRKPDLLHPVGMAVVLGLRRRRLRRPSAR